MNSQELTHELTADDDRCVQAKAYADEVVFEPDKHPGDNLGVSSC